MGFGSFLGGMGRGAADIADDARKNEIEMQQRQQQYDMMLRNGLIGSQQQHDFKQQDVMQEEARLRDPTRAAEIARAKLTGETIAAQGKSDFETRDTITKGNNVDYLNSLQSIDQSANAAKLQASKDDLEGRRLAAEATVKSAELRGRVGGSSGYTPAQLQKMQDDIDENYAPGPERDAAMASLYGEADSYSPKASSGMSAILPKITSTASALGVPPAIVAGVAHVENGGKANTSPTGVQGVMQITKATGAKYGMTDSSNVDEQITVGTKHIKSLMDRYASLPTPVPFAVQAYSSGEATVDLARSLATNAGKDGSDFKQVQPYLAPAFKQMQDAGKIPKVSNGNPVKGDFTYADKVLKASALYGDTGTVDASPAPQQLIHPKMQASILSELKDKDNVGPRFDAIADAIQSGGMGKSKAIAMFIDAEWDPKQGVFLRDGKPIIVKHNAGNLDEMFNALAAKQTGSEKPSSGKSPTLADAQAAMGETPSRDIPARTRGGTVASSMSESFLGASPNTRAGGNPAYREEIKQPVKKAEPVKQRTRGGAGSNY